jgi:hypothetical protein
MSARTMEGQPDLSSLSTEVAPPLDTKGGAKMPLLSDIFDDDDFAPR